MREVMLSSYGLLTVAEAAARRGVSPRTIINWVDSAGIPVVVLGRKRNKVYLVPLVELDAFEPRPAGAPAGNQFARKAPKKKLPENRGIRETIIPGRRIVDRDKTRHRT